jgi:trk system potassium uptake protein TrkA
MLDLLPLGGGVLVQAAEVQAWDGKALAELNLTNKHKVMVVAVKKAGQEDYVFVPNPTEPLGRGDSLVLIGKPEAVLALEP